MTFFTRNNLQYQYQWVTTYDDPKLRGNPDHSLFNRHEGWEVLYMINKFGEIYQVHVLTAGLKIERMIRNHLPANIHSQVYVRQ